MKKTFAQTAFNASDKINRIRACCKEKGRINVSEIIIRERINTMIDFLFVHAYTPIANLKMTAYVSSKPLPLFRQKNGEYQGW